MLNIFGVLAIIFLLAFLVETLVEFLFGTIAGLVVAVAPELKGFLAGDFKAPFLQMCAVIAGLIGAMIYRFDVLYLLGNFLEINIQMTAFGLAITGIAIGKGSSYIHQLIKRFFPAKNQEPEPRPVTEPA